MTIEEYAQEISDTMARAVREGYDVRSAAIDHYVETLPATSGHKGKPTLVKRPSPSQKAFTVLDGLIKDYAESEPPDGVSLGGWQICRATWPDGDQTTVVSAVLVTPWFSVRTLLWDAE